MLAGAAHGQIDTFWNTRWIGGVTCPQDGGEYLSCLLLVHQQDAVQARRESKALSEVPLLAHKTRIVSALNDVQRRNATLSS